LENGEKAKNGFEALSSLDTTGNKLIDSRDEAFDNLLLWIDSNGNGKSEAKELSTLADNKIYSISLEYDEINELTNSEAIIGNESKFTYTNGESSKIGEMWVSSDLYDALETIIAEPTEEIAGLPNVRSIGRLNSLHTAMVRDDTGRLIALVRNFTKEQDREKRLEMVRQILCIMSKSEEIDPSSRGGYIDAKHLAVVEAVLGKDFFGINGSNPNPTAAVLLEEIYNNILNTYYFAMLFSRTYEYIDNISVIENEDETITYDLDSFNAYVTESINNGTMDGSMFTDVSSSLNFISVVTLGDHSLLIVFMDYISANHNDYLPLVYGSVYDAIRGSSDADELYGTDKDDIIISDEGDDFISAGNGNDYILGLEDSDTLYGDNGDDVLDGGTGNDILYGGYGDDSYRFGRNCGKDTINEQGRNSGNDKVVFGKEITVDDIVVSRDGNDMILTLKDSDDSLRIAYQYADSYYWIESFEFSDGTVLTADDWFDTSLVISGSETIEDYDGGYGTRDTTLIGSKSDDAIYGYSGNDILDGGAGDDSLYGGYDDDIYIFGKKYGQDTINEQGRNSSNDKVIFGEGITGDDIVVSRDGGDMILTVKDTDDSLRIVHQYYDSYYWIESFEFSDGTVLTADDWFDTSLVISGSETIEDYDGGYGTRDTTLIGSDFDDSIYGYSGNDILDGGAGNDSLYGGYGDDVYKFGKGCGQDTINEQGRNSSNDKVIFGKEITVDDIVVSRDGNDMILTIKGTSDSLRITYQYGDSYYRIEWFEFANGTEIESDAFYNTSLTITGSGLIVDYDGGYGVRNTTLIGSSSADSIYGYSGNDILDGGAGNDSLYGGYDDDIYIFDKKYGQDTINEQGRNSSNDKVVFGKGITVDDIVVSRDGGDMILTVKDTDDSLRIVHQYYDSYYWIESFEFSDGTVLTADNWFDTSLVISGCETIEDYDGGYGTRDTTLIGSDFDDSIYGYSGNDILDGGAGNDSLYGGYGDDVYKFGKGCGQDTINEQGRNSGNDKVVFGKGITVDDIVVSRDGNDMILTLKDTDDSLRIVHQYYDSYYWIESFEFSDGTVLTADDWFDTSLVISGCETIEDYDGGYGTRDTTLIGSESDDAIYGYSGNDILDGSAGDDSLYGGYDDDIYIFGKKYGQDTINEQGRNSGNDKVVFGKGITVDDIVVSRDGNDMILTLKDTDDSLRIVHQYYDSYYWIESFEFSDGTVLTADDWFDTSLVISGSETIEDYDGGYGTRDTTLIGSKSDDAIYGYSGNDILDGGAGNDSLYGGYGDDVYRFGRGYGQDTINEQGRNSNGDRVIFGENVSIDDILLTSDGTDLIISIKDTGDSLRIVYQNYDSYYRIEFFEFSDGTVAEIDYQQMTLKEVG
nr:hypothetical protein [Ruminococcus sp.]